jgi:mannose-1-phosphate guanylyltransferase
MARKTLIFVWTGARPAKIKRRSCCCGIRPQLFSTNTCSEVFMIILDMQAHPWAIVLAGGDGRRLEKFVIERFGERRPKQFCAFTGTRSMFEHTIDRANHNVHKSRIFAVLTQNHLDYAGTQLDSLDINNIIVQPSQRDTAPGLLLALHRVLHEDPSAVVMVFPSDHFVLDEERFMQEVDRANHYVALHPETIVLLGAEPTAPETSYGWIEPGRVLSDFRGRGIFDVKTFREKPDRDTAVVLHDQGSLWNTMVIAGRAKKLLEHFKQTVPALYETFESIPRSVRDMLDKRTIRKVYQNLPSINFSTAVLERIPQQLAVLRLSGVYWSDWGDENRIVADCQKFELRLNGTMPEMDMGFASS